MTALVTLMGIRGTCVGVSFIDPCSGRTRGLEPFSLLRVYNYFS
jgi:hypothetical protein